MTAQEDAGFAKEKWGQIKLDGEFYPILGGTVTYENLARFLRKLTLGDYTRDSDDLISSIIYGDFSGGGQILNKYRAGAHQSRMWWAEGLHTRDPFALTMARKVDSFAYGDNAYPLGDLNGVFYFSFDKEIRAWDESTGDFGAVLDTMDEQPVNLGVEFGETAAGGATVMWIPHGTNGYTVFDGTTCDAAATTITPIAFQEWDGKLFALESTGRLSHWTYVTWDTSDGQLDRRHTARNLIVYSDVAGSPVLWAITNKGVWAYDATNNIFYQSNFQVPPHPSNGFASDVWQAGGSAYYAAGMGVYRYAVGSTISAIGLDRDEGVPARYRGQIVDLRAAHNELYALIQGVDSGVEDADDLYEMDETIPYDDAMYTSPSAAYSSLDYWTGFGWHNAWTSDAAGTCTRVYVSAGDDHYRVWWGFGDSAYTISIPVDFHNPMQGLEAGVDEFGASGSLETAWFDADMKGFTKIGAYVQAIVPRAAADEKWTFQYQRDFETGWTNMPSNAEITAPGKRVMSFGMEGLAWDRIRFRVTATVLGGDSSKSPILDSFGLYFVKNPNSGASWTFDVPMPARSYMGRAAKHVIHELDQLATKEGFVVFTHQGTNYRVRVSQEFGENGTAQDRRGTRRMSLVAIPEPRDELDETEHAH